MPRRGKNPHPWGTDLGAINWRISGKEWRGFLGKPPSSLAPSTVPNLGHTFRSALSPIEKFMSAIPQPRTEHALFAHLLAELLIFARHGRLGRAALYRVGEDEPNTHWFLGLPFLLLN